MAAAPQSQDINTRQVIAEFGIAAMSGMGLGRVKTQALALSILWDE
jgi:hypothetical protein